MRKLGQNFLVDMQVRDAIVESAGVRPDDLVIEVGPGRGVLTNLLAEQAGQVIAIEVDPELARSLEKAYADRPQVRVVEADALSCDFKKLVREHTLGAGEAGRVIVVANLPYCITTPILRKLFDDAPLFSLFVLMVQLEVAEKIVAPPGSRAYGVLSVEAHYYTDPEVLFTVPPSAFSPAPKVHSAVIRMPIMRTPPVDSDPDTLFALVRAGFGRRRKSLRNSLLDSPVFGGDPSAVMCALTRAGIDGSRRAETLSLDEFAAVVRASEYCGAGD